MAEALKFDVRVRERLLKQGLLTEAEVEQHLARLPDRADGALEIGIKQPALQTEAEREVLVVRTLARPAQPVPPPRMYGDDDEAYADEKPSAEPDLDDEDEDDEDEDEGEGEGEVTEGEVTEGEKTDDAKSEEKGSVDDDWG